MRRPRGRRVVASRGLEFEVTIRGSGTPAASELARHCEATGVSLPRKGRVHESVRGQSPVSHYEGGNAVINAVPNSISIQFQEYGRE